jgi:hypothetical protein
MNHRTIISRRNILLNHISHRRFTQSVSASTVPALPHLRGNSKTCVNNNAIISQRSAVVQGFASRRSQSQSQLRSQTFSSSTNNLPSSNSTSNLPQQQTTSSDGVVATPINFDTSSTIEGNESQIVTISLEPNQVLRAESGAMMYMTDGVEMNTTTGGGMSSGFKRMLTGQNLFISDYSYKGKDGTRGTVCLGTDFPSKILRLNVEEYGGKIVCQKGALLCASHTIDIEMEFTKKFSTGFFGGEGFVLQGLVGSGDVFVKAGG